MTDTETDILLANATLNYVAQPKSQTTANASSCTESKNLNSTTSSGL